MTPLGITFDPTVPDPVVLTLDGPDYYAGGWARGLDDQPATHRDGCQLADFPAPICACQPPL